LDNNNNNNNAEIKVTDGLISQSHYLATLV